MDWTLLEPIIRDASITIIFGFLWWFERVDRRAAEIRERELMMRMMPIGYAHLTGEKLDTTGLH